MNEAPTAVCDFSDILPDGVALTATGHSIRVLDPNANDVTAQAVDAGTLAPTPAGTALQVATRPGLAAALYRCYFSGRVATVSPTTQERVFWLRVAAEP